MTNSSSRTPNHCQIKKKVPKSRPAQKSRICRTPRPGQKCSKCGKGKLDYDGLLQLCCPACGYLASSGGFT